MSPLATARCIHTFFPGTGNEVSDPHRRIEIRAAEHAEEREKMNKLKENKIYNEPP